MDITKTIVSLREAALLYGDYSTYWTQLSHKLLNSRKKLNVATKNRGKFHTKTPVTPEQIGENHEYATLQLLTAERAWANAMSMKASHSAESKGISGKARSHIVSRLEKGAKVASKLADALAQSSASGASKTDVLEARAYASLLSGAAQFEKQSWEPCLKSYSVARIIYSALSTSAKADIFKDLLSETIDPSIRYAAYQLKIPRTRPIPSIAQRAFPRSDSELVESIKEVNSHVLEKGDTAMEGAPDGDGTPSTITWRQRQVTIEDAAIAVAWSTVSSEKAKLVERLSSSASLLPKDAAAAYDDILTATQDAVDATKHAIDELKKEGVQQSDRRMQSLQITRTAVTYEMISWRIGRNRVLMGEKDGATQDTALLSKRQLKRAQKQSENQKEEAPGRRIARLKEKVVLYDGTLQSLESIQELPGVAADEELSAQLAATINYFEALKSLAVARSYSIAGDSVNALALTKYAHDKAQEALPVLSGGQNLAENSPRNIAVTKQDIVSLGDLLSGELQRSRALVEVSTLQKPGKAAGSKTAPLPLVERLSEYPSEGVDLKNIVVYPPKMDSIPVKPLFLDVAWNYITYPSKQAKPEQGGKAAASVKTTAGADEAKPQKRGWFGFGR
ncbi:hypothetical protein CONLIGDRAFT_572006 [Coniochaeta ligniaria NRRL 30616]|uniref:Signal recognition particle subunit SRP68 n=1 Tax=Coniochaeta ligniaria NRRL 30616 TaxID=1408157 RepID=A0A1J7IZ06_9PEZI|nr:hypothetical protein CONLIGDRAFT_572006 [Coniochaeta ligniaria NRRL 30616]